MNISKAEQRVLHALAQGGDIRHRRDPSRRVIAAPCFTREGYVLTDGTLAVFQRLRKRGFIASHGGKPYRITRAGLLAVRAQLDNR
ncbi:MAG: YjhX family toxin [Sphingopyxis sp.]|nr:YjhX family toxin [Sphingopyxis sp.]